VQIISLLHHLQFIIYKHLLSNAQQFKGPSRSKFRTLSTDMEFKCRTIRVKVVGLKQLLHHTWLLQIIVIIHGITSNNNNNNNNNNIFHYVIYNE